MGCIRICSIELHPTLAGWKRAGRSWFCLDEVIPPKKKAGYFIKKHPRNLKKQPCLFFRSCWWHQASNTLRSLRCLLKYQAAKPSVAMEAEPTMTPQRFCFSIAPRWIGTPQVKYPTYSNLKTHWAEWQQLKVWHPKKAGVCLAPLHCWWCPRVQSRAYYDANMVQIDPDFRQFASKSYSKILDFLWEISIFIHFHSCPWFLQSNW